MTYRNDLPEIPPRLRSLPVQNGYPVPWFAAKVDGVFDFRVVDDGKFAIAIKKQLCWICGQKLGAYLAFAIGPMCVINRTTSEPPAHRECAEWAAKACPFLIQRQDVRRESHLPEGVKDAPGFHSPRQPCAVCIYITKSFQPFKVPTEIRGAGHGMLIDLGEPVEVLWMRQGRAATRVEVMESIDSGYPALLELAERDGAAGVRALERLRLAALKLLPQECTCEVNHD